MQDSESAPSVKILVCYHKPATLVENEIFVPIHVGRAQAGFSKDGYIQDNHRQWLLDHMIGDDTGDNISDKTLTYSELTALYWAWKNYDRLGDPDYIGLMHYRRFLIFHPEPPVNDYWWSQFGSFHAEVLTRKIIDKYLTPAYILKDLEQNDLYLYRIPTSEYPQESEGEERARQWGQELRLSLDCLQENYPELHAVTHEYFSRREGNRCNLMLMRKKLFFEYCAFLFEYLEKVEKRIDTTFRYCCARDRVMGLIAEWTLGIWAMHKSKSGQCKVKGLPIIFVDDPTPQIELHPAFSEHNIPICCACDNKYALPCGVMLRSLIEHASPENNYDLIILDNGISRENKAKLVEIIPPTATNISLRFYHIRPSIIDEPFYTRSYYTKTCYCKLYIPTVLKEYDRALYLDADTLVMEDVAQLYHTDLSGNWLGVSSDYDILARLRTDDHRTEKIEMPQLGLDDALYQYFDAGILVMDLHRLREARIEREWQNTARCTQYENMDHDILNLHCKGHVTFIDSSWNVQPDTGPRKKSMWRFPAKTHEKWIADRQAPKIVHYSSSAKPWKNSAIDMAHYWWRYARMTPFYEEIIYTHLKNAAAGNIKKAVAALDEKWAQDESVQNLEKEIERLETRLKKTVSSHHALQKITQQALNLGRLQRTYLFYRVASHLTFGKLRQHCEQEKRRLRAQICKIQAFIYTGKPSKT